MKKIFLISVLFLTLVFASNAQDKPISPSYIGVGQYHGLSQALRDVPAMTKEEYEKMEIDANKPRNEEIRERFYPFASTALPKGDDPAWQREMGATSPPKAPIVSFDGQTSPYFPPDCNGEGGPNHYMQTITSVYSLKNK